MEDLFSQLKTKNNKELRKGGLVAQGYKNAMKQSLVHSNADETQPSTKMSVRLYAIISFQLWASDVTSVFAKFC